MESPPDGRQPHGERTRVGRTRALGANAFPPVECEANARLPVRQLAWVLGLLIFLGVFVWLLAVGEDAGEPSAGVPPSPGGGHAGQPMGTAATAPASGLDSAALGAASAPASVAATQADPFKVFVEAQKNGQLPPAQPMQRSGPATGDPFAQALEESQRRQAGAGTFPFGASK